MQILAEAGDSGALFNKGVTLGQLERSEEAVGVYDEVLARFGDATEAALREQVAQALQRKVEVESPGSPVP
jgi:TolA-binding protein